MPKMTRAEVLLAAGRMHDAIDALETAVEAYGTQRLRRFRRRGVRGHGHGAADVLDQVPEALAHGRVGQHARGEGFAQQLVQVAEVFAGFGQVVAAAGVAQPARVFVHQGQAVDVPAILEEAMQAAADQLHPPGQVAKEGVPVTGES